MAGCVSLRRGETLGFEFAWQQDDGTPIDVSAGTLTGHVADALGVQVDTLTFAPIPNVLGAYTVSSAGPTSAWPAGALSASVTLTLNGAVDISDALTIEVLS